MHQVAVQVKWQNWCMTQWASEARDNVIQDTGIFEINTLVRRVKDECCVFYKKYTETRSCSVHYPNFLIGRTWASKAHETCYMNDTERKGHDCPLHYPPVRGPACTIRI